MYDLSEKFNTFYKSFVVLPQTEQNMLFRKKNLNLQRLKDGLEEYNQENKTSYSIIEDCVQGSVAMSTVVQNEQSDYDIDAAVVFSDADLDGKGPRASKNMVAKALEYKTKMFNAKPEVKTSCVRVKYEEGYHIDFAVYKKSYDCLNNEWIYEHAGDEWTRRELKGLTDWFKTQNDNSGGKLRKVVRLSKMFCKSRDSWKNMPSGLLQTVLCDEKLQGTYDRIDELFYYTMVEVVNRIEKEPTVAAPVDNGRDLTPRQSDRQKMINWKNRLKSKLADLEILFEENCSQLDAVQAWYGFFNHEFWKNESDKSQYREMQLTKDNVCSFVDNEQFIEDMLPVNEIYSCKIQCVASGNGWRPKPISEFFSMFKRFLPHNLEIRCTMQYTNCPDPYIVLWKVKNVGVEAEKRNQLRGEIKDKGKTIVEHTNFYGRHYIECYIIKDGVCVARDKVDVPIGRDSRV